MCALRQAAPCAALVPIGPFGATRAVQDGRNAALPPQSARGNPTATMLPSLGSCWAAGETPGSGLRRNGGF